MLNGWICFEWFDQESISIYRGSLGRQIPTPPFGIPITPAQTCRQGANSSDLSVPPATVPTDQEARAVRIFSIGRWREGAVIGRFSGLFLWAFPVRRCQPVICLGSISGDLSLICGLLRSEVSAHRIRRLIRKFARTLFAMKKFRRQIGTTRTGSLTLVHTTVIDSAQSTRSLRRTLPACGSCGCGNL